MSETAYRDVIVSIQAEPHPDNVQAFMEFARQIAKAQEQGQKSASETIQSALQEQRAGLQKHIADVKKINQELARSHENVTAAIKQQTLASGKANAQLINIENSRLAAQKRAEDAAKLAGQAYAIELEKQKKEYADATKTISKNNDVIAEGVARAMTGVMSLGRGFAMLGLIGKESTAKMLELLIKIQAIFDIMRGGIDIIVAMKKAWTAYTAAIEAANAAKIAHAAISAVMPAAGGAAGRIGTGVAGGAVGGAVGAAGIGVAGGVVGVGAAGAAALVGGAAGGAAMYETGRNLITGQGAKPGSFLDIVGGWESAAAGWVESTLKANKALDVLTETLGHPVRVILRWLSDDRVTGRSAEKTEKLRSRFQAEREMFERQTAGRQESLRHGNELWSAQSEYLRETGQMSTRMAATRFGAAGRFMQRAYDPRWAPNTPALQETRIASAERFKTAGMDYIEAAKKEYDIVRDITMERIRGAKEYLKSQQDAIKAEKQKLTIIKQQYMSAKERFGLLSKGEQQNVLQAMARFRQGRGTRADAQILQPFSGLPEVGDLLQKFAVDRAEAGSFQLLGEPSNRRIIEGGQAVQRAQIKLDAGIKLDHGLTITLTSNEAEIRKRFDDAWKNQEQRIKTMVANVVMAALQSRRQLESDQAERKITGAALAEGGL